jgi:putative DNA primase/helicase
LKVVEKLVSRPIETANISLAALFRLITNYSPTLLIDEADTFMEGKSEMAGVVNKGYERGGVVLRVESSNRGDQIERAFEVFGPKAMAGIMLERHLPSATMSRGIQIPLKRKTKDDTVLRLLQQIRRCLLACALGFSNSS